MWFGVGNKYVNVPQLCKCPQNHRVCALVKGRGSHTDCKNHRTHVGQKTRATNKNQVNMTITLISSTTSPTCSMNKHERQTRDCSRILIQARPSFVGAFYMFETHPQCIVFPRLAFRWKRPRRKGGGEGGVRAFWENKFRPPSGCINRQSCMHRHWRDRNVQRRVISNEQHY